MRTLESKALSAGLLGLCIAGSSGRDIDDVLEQVDLLVEARGWDPGDLTDTQVSAIVQEFGYAPMRAPASPARRPRVARARAPVVEAPAAPQRTHEEILERDPTWRSTRMRDLLSTPGMAR